MSFVVLIVVCSCWLGQGKQQQDEDSVMDKLSNMTKQDILQFVSNYQHQIQQRTQQRLQHYQRPNSQQYNPFKSTDDQLSRLIQQYYQGLTMAESHDIVIQPGETIRFSLDTKVESTIISINVGELDSQLLLKYIDSPSRQQDILVREGSQQRQCGVACAWYMKNPYSQIVAKNVASERRYMMVTFDYQKQIINTTKEQEKTGSILQASPYTLTTLKENFMRHAETCHHNLRRINKIRSQMVTHQERMLMLTMVEALVVLLLSYLQYKGIKALFNPHIY